MKETVVMLCCVLVCGVLLTGINAKRSRQFAESAKSDNIMDVTDFSIYYDVKTNETIKDMLPRPWYKPGWLLRLPFTGGPCTCKELKCKCCTGIRIQSFNFDRETCALLTYQPTDALIDMEVTMKNESVYRSSFSAKNPPPFCVPIPVPYLPPGLVDMCIRLFDINIVDQKLHVCMDMDTRIDKAPVLILHYDCMDMGVGGVGLSKPGGGSNNVNSSDASTQDPPQLDSDVYDVVTEGLPMTTPLFNNTIKYI